MIFIIVRFVSFVLWFIFSIISVPLQNCKNNYNAMLWNNMFLTLQTVYMNLERRWSQGYPYWIATFIKLHLSNVLWYYLRAPDERPYRLFWFCNQNKLRTRFAATLNCANSYYTTLGHNMFFILQTIFPTAIFHFQFSIFHLMNLSTRIRYGGSPCRRIISSLQNKNYGQHSPVNRS